MYHAKDEFDLLVLKLTPYHVYEEANIHIPNQLI